MDNRKKVKNNRQGCPTDFGMGGRAAYTDFSIGGQGSDGGLGWVWLGGVGGISV